MNPAYSNLPSIVSTDKPRLAASEFAAWQQSLKESKQVADAFQNVLARTGFGTNNLLEGTNYPLTRLSYNYPMLTSMYRGNWIVRKVVDGIPDDMTKHWITIVNDLDPEDIKKFDRVCGATLTSSRINESIKWARLYGGAAAIMILDGVSQDEMAEPLEMDAVELDSYRGLLVFDRWSGISPNSEIHTDVNNPLEFGLPASYRVTMEGGQGFDVHSSRVLRFTGPQVPRWEWQAEQRWGISEIEVMYEELKKRDNTSFNIASLIFRANIFELKEEQMAQALSGLNANAAAQQRFYQMLQTQNWLMSNQGLFVTGKDQSVNQHSYAFGGLNDIYVSFMLDICGATGYSMAKLFGRTVSGLGQSNEGDEHNYEDLVNQKQMREMDPQLMKLIPVIFMSTLGKVPDDLAWHYNPVRVMNHKDKAELSKTISESVAEMYNAAIIDRPTALKELKASADETGIFSNITDEQIAKAEEENELAPSPTERRQQLEIPFEGDRPGETSADNPVRQTEKPVADASPGTTFPSQYRGLPIRIEQRRNDVRQGPDWTVRMTCPYGFIAGTKGVDGAEVDCFIGPYHDSGKVFVVHTKTPISGAYDEDKLFLGFDSAEQAQQAFIENYTDPEIFGSMEEISWEQLMAALQKPGNPIGTVA